MEKYIIKSLEKGKSTWSFLYNPQGKIVDCADEKNPKGMERLRKVRDMLNIFMDERRLSQTVGIATDDANKTFAPV